KATNCLTVAAVPGSDYVFRPAGDRYFVAVVGSGLATLGATVGRFSRTIDGHRTGKGHPVGPLWSSYSHCRRFAGSTVRLEQHVHFLGARGGGGLVDSFAAGLTAFRAGSQ